ncbi:DUF1697 domain-containing protein [Catenuloplanes japonicus]|uniref:DUF1697 domain-containing protein n=1 Tax=Catenuloplanes japonicus TaxID=33876 RepID=UPI0005249DFB|nr:DUF1697 domain-containing protein [Catenuloplanes japonicus]
MTRYVLLLRGINLGRNRRIGMADLRELLTAEGYANVATLLQSGNVLLDSGLPRGELGPAVERAIEKRFGMAVEVILRDRADLAAVVAENPLAGVADDGSRFTVSFLSGPLTTPIGELLAGVDPVDDRFAARDTEIYVWCPHGLSNSPVITALGKIKNQPSATVRNWNTVQKLLAMMD